MKFNYIFLSVLLSTNCSFAQTFTLGDNYSSNGDGTVVGVSGTTTGNSLIEGTGLYRQSDGASGNPSFYNAIMVGSEYGGGDVWRAVTTFDLNGLDIIGGGVNAAPAGFEYQVDEIRLIVEVSGGNDDPFGSPPNPRPATQIDFYEGSFPTGVLPGTNDGTQLFDDPSDSFITVTISNSALDLNSDTSYTLTWDAPGAALDPANNFYTFGSGLSPNNIGFSGTNFVEKSPELEIDYSLVAVPESSSALLIGGVLTIINFRRKRR